MVAALLDGGAHAGHRVLDQLTEDRHLAVPDELARPVDGAEAQGREFDSVVAPVVASHPLRGNLADVIDEHRMARVVLPDRRVRGMPVLRIGDLPVRGLGTGEDHPLDADMAGHLADVDRTHRIDLKTQQRVGLHLPGHQRRHVDHPVHRVLLGRRNQRGKVADVGLHDRKLSGDVAGEGHVRSVLQNDRQVPSFEQLAGD